MLKKNMEKKYSTNKYDKKKILYSRLAMKSDAKIICNH